MPSSNHKVWAAAAVLLLASTAAGCVSFGGDARAVYDISRQVISPHRVSLDEAASSPYASLGLRIGSGGEMMIVLATDSGKEQLWLSSAHIGITTSEGRVVRTAGLTHDLGALILQGGKTGRQGTAATRWLADFPDLKAYGVPVLCQRRTTGNETIEILGHPIETRRVAENCRAESVTFIWTFENTYWIDPDSGFVWRSVQHVNPKIDALTLEVLRPPA